MANIGCPPRTAFYADAVALTIACRCQQAAMTRTDATYLTLGNHLQHSLRGDQRSRSFGPSFPSSRLGTPIRKALLCHPACGSVSVNSQDATSLTQHFVATSEAGASGIGVPKLEFGNKARQRQKGNKPFSLSRPLVPKLPAWERLSAKLCFAIMPAVPYL